MSNLLILGAGGFGHTGANAGVDQEILAEPLGK